MAVYLWHLRAPDRKWEETRKPQWIVAAHTKWAAHLPSMVGGGESGSATLRRFAAANRGLRIKSKGYDQDSDSTNTDQIPVKTATK